MARWKRPIIDVVVLFIHAMIVSICAGWGVVVGMLIFPGNQKAHKRCATAGLVLGSLIAITYVRSMERAVEDADHSEPKE